MNYHVRFFPVALLLLALSSAANAQSNQTKPVAPGKDRSSKSAKNADADRVIRERRAQARSLLVSLASDARNFSDPALRGRSLARIADALWDVDAEQARALFRKGWEAAEAADVENHLKMQEEIRKQKAVTGGGFAIDLPPDVRREVLRLTSRRDRALGEEFLEKLKIQKQAAATEFTVTKLSSSSLSDAQSQRLNLAQELLSAGDAERALQFADPVLSTVNMDTINFLSTLREKNPLAADQRYSGLLVSTGSNTQADANTISLLSSYIFTPHLFVTFERGGMSSSQMSNSIVPAIVASELRSAFFQTAAAVLSRPQPPPEQDQSTSGIEGKYRVIKRLLPFFEQFAPGGITDLMRGQLDALSASVSENLRQGDDDWVRKGVKPEKAVADQEQTLLDRIDHAKTSTERDALYLQLAFRAAGRGDMRARDFVGKIDESELRKRAQGFVDAALATNAINKKLTEQALELARIGDLTHIQKSWLLSQSAKLLAKTERDKSLEILEDAATEARRIDVSDPYRPRALLAVANVLLLLDPSRAWDATFEAVKAANSAEGFTGEDGELVLKFQSQGQSSVHSNNVPDFDVAGIFGKLASIDYDRAVELTRGFSGEAPRASATIAIARAVIDQRPPKALTAQDAKQAN
jgi:hypothetical protein